MYEILQPLGVSEKVLRNRVFGLASYILLQGFLYDHLEVFLFANLKRLHLDIG
jgi:hypothetical protein